MIETNNEGMDYENFYEPIINREIINHCVGIESANIINEDGTSELFTNIIYYQEDGALNKLRLPVGVKEENKSTYYDKDMMQLMYMGLTVDDFRNENKDNVDVTLLDDGAGEDKFFEALFEQSWGNGVTTIRKFLDRDIVNPETQQDITDAFDKYCEKGLQREAETQNNLTDTLKKHASTKEAEKELKEYFKTVAKEQVM